MSTGIVYNPSVSAIAASVVVYTIANLSGFNVVTAVENSTKTDDA
uniref:Uncharacterized protein n=1 Tax=Strigamia maritima TaxID=126957 RepID=T1JAB4_STRMM